MGFCKKSNFQFSYDNAKQEIKQNYTPFLKTTYENRIGTIKLLNCK